MYYHFISKYDPKNRIRSIPGIENRLRELNILLKEANEPDMNPLNKLTILIAEGLKVSRDEDFVDQLFHLFKYIIYSDLDITLHVGLIRASLSVSGLIFALEYSRRKHKNPKAWNRVAEILVEFYSELGYGGVVDAIEHVVFMENERINKIYNALKCDEDKFNNFKGILSNELKEYIYLIESRFKSKHSLLKKIQRKRIDLNDMDRINESIHDLNGIRIVLKESSMLGDVLNKLTHIVSSKFQGARVIEIELYNLDISSLDNLNIVKKRTERDYRAAHVLIMDQMTNRKIEVQIVGDPEQYRKHLYAGL
ncbi:MAG: hypothetical protein NZ908_00005, partial [Candidatus Micrarchaeota archaeon]|nr:hypothetical protein [Candidatus Micrarchaeota archaeon]